MVSLSIVVLPLVIYKTMITGISLPGACRIIVHCKHLLSWWVGGILTKLRLLYTFRWATFFKFVFFGQSNGQRVISNF